MQRDCSSIALLIMLAAATGLIPSMHAVAQESDNARDRFDELDRNGDDVVTRDEWSRRFLFNRLDANGDDRITRDEARQWFIEALRRRDDRRPLVIPEELRDVAMRVHRDIQYVEREGVDANLLSLDIYAPPKRKREDHEAEESATRYPVVVMIHGGGWSIGDKANQGLAAIKSRYFTANDCLFVSVNYRLSPEIKHPAHVEDVAAALAWIHENVVKYDGDPDRLFVMGHSAGAHLAALVSTDESRLEEHGKNSGIIQGTILLDGAGYDLKRYVDTPNRRVPAIGMYEDAFGPKGEGWIEASPRHYVEPGESMPPFVIFHVGNRLASAVASREFAEALRAAGTSAAVFRAPDKDHAAVNRDIGRPGDEPTRIIMDFIHGARPEDLERRAP